MAEKFILVSLEEEKAKKLAQTISSETCRKILDYLGDKEEASESEIAKDLDLPISTVHYNLQLLLKNGLVESKEFVWSKKGKEVNLYKIAKKLIVIAPKGISGIKSKLKTIVPTILVLAIAAAFIQFFSKNIAQKFAAAPQVMEEGARAVPEAVGKLAEAPAQISAVPNYALWFLFGAIFALIMYLIFNWRLKK